MDPVAKSILIVEDEEIVRRFLLNSLNSRYNCYTAETAGRAIELLKYRSFDLVLIDVGLPDMSGFHLCSRVQAIRPDAAVVILSGHNDQDTAARAAEAGAAAFIGKPFSLLEVVLTVKHALEGCTK